MFKQKYFGQFGAI